MNIGEEICGEWLQHVKECDFVQYNFKALKVQGEIDVIGINLKNKEIFVCEVAVHLITGLQYVKNNRPDNVSKIAAKFRKDIDYIKETFPGYRHTFMLWSPIVKSGKVGSEYNQQEDVRKIVALISEELSTDIIPIINEKFDEVLKQLRAIARDTTKELDSSVMRYLQVEEHLGKFLSRQQMRR